MSSPSHPKVVLEAYELVKWSLPKIAELPRSHLDRVNVLLARFRFQNRLAKDLRLWSLGVYEEVARRTDEVGRQVGGWVRSLKEGAA